VSIEEQRLHEAWSKETPIEYQGKKYSVHKMSYGQYFLEPSGRKSKETDSFRGDEIWLVKDKNNKTRYVSEDEETEAMA
jgi:hypothetical protein